MSQVSKHWNQCFQYYISILKDIPKKSALNYLEHNILWNNMDILQVDKCYVKRYPLLCRSQCTHYNTTVYKIVDGILSNPETYPPLELEDLIDMIFPGYILDLPAGQIEVSG